MRTLLDMAKEAREAMVQTVIAEGAANNRDLAADVLLRAGYRPAHIAVLFDDVMADAREFMAPPAFGPNVVFLHGARP